MVINVRVSMCDMGLFEKAVSEILNETFYIESEYLDELVYLSKKDYFHIEEGFNFKYKYMIHFKGAIRNTFENLMLGEVQIVPAYSSLHEEQKIALLSSMGLDYIFLSDEMLYEFIANFNLSRTTLLFRLEADSESNDSVSLESLENDLRDVVRRVGVCEMLIEMFTDKKDMRAIATMDWLMPYQGVINRESL